MRALTAGVIYFLLVFAVEWILGPIRELWAVPHFGRMAATLSEAVIMLIAMVVAARWVIRRFHVSRTLPATISMGPVALALFGACRDRRRCLGARAFPPRLYCELSDRPWCDLTDHVPAFCSDADACDAGWVSFPA